MLQYYGALTERERAYLEWLLQMLEGLAVACFGSVLLSCPATRSSGKKIAEVAKIIAVGNLKLTFHTRTQANRERVR